MSRNAFITGGARYHSVLNHRLKLSRASSVLTLRILFEVDRLYCATTAPCVRIYRSVADRLHHKPSSGRYATPWRRCITKLSFQKDHSVKPS